MLLLATLIGCAGPEPEPAEPPRAAAKPKRETPPVAPATSEPEPPPQSIVDPISGAHLVLVQPGEFVRRWTDTRGHTHEYTVSVKKAFYIGKYEISQAQWTRVMDENPSRFRHPDHPVESIDEAQVGRFLRKTRLRLPTRAEWELVARMTPPMRTAAEQELRAFWHAGNSGGRTHPIGTTSPNGACVHDILGNVAEIVQRYVSDAPNTGARPDIVGRGGSFATPADDCGPRHRIEVYWPTQSSNQIGFRVARDPEP